MNYQGQLSMPYPMMHQPVRPLSQQQQQSTSYGGQPQGQLTTTHIMPHHPPHFQYGPPQNLMYGGYPPTYPYMGMGYPPPNYVCPMMQPGGSCPYHHPPPPPQFMGGWTVHRDQQYSVPQTSQKGSSNSSSSTKNKVPPGILKKVTRYTAPETIKIEPSSDEDEEEEEDSVVEEVLTEKVAQQAVSGLSSRSFQDFCKSFVSSSTSIDDDVDGADKENMTSTITTTKKQTPAPRKSTKGKKSNKHFS